MLGMTGVRGGQTQTTGYVQPRVGLYKTQNRGQSWTLIWMPPLDPVIPSNPNIGAGVGDTMFGVRHVKLDPRNSRDRLRDGLEQRDSPLGAVARERRCARSSPSSRSSAAPASAISRCSISRSRTATRGCTSYNGTDAVAPQALYRLDNADVPAASLVTGSGRRAREHVRLDQALVGRLQRSRA